MRRFFWMIPCLAACDEDKGGAFCTEVGCSGVLTLQVTGAGSEPAGLSGQVTVADRTYAVDCAGTSEPEVTCDGDTVTISLGEDGDGDVVWSLTADGDGTGSGGGDYAGSGTVTPAWTSDQPNGPDCPPTCWTGDATVELLGTP